MRNRCKICGSPVDKTRPPISLEELQREKERLAAEQAAQAEQEAQTGGDTETSGPPDVSASPRDSAPVQKTDAIPASPVQKAGTGPGHPGQRAGAVHGVPVQKTDAIPASPVQKAGTSPGHPGQRAGAGHGVPVQKTDGIPGSPGQRAGALRGQPWQRAGAPRGNPALTGNAGDRKNNSQSGFSLDYFGERIPIPGQGAWIGRDGLGKEWFDGNLMISRQHVYVRPDPRTGRLQVNEDKSLNGVFYTGPDGARVRIRGVRMMQPGEILWIYNIPLRIIF